MSLRPKALQGIGSVVRTTAATDEVQPLRRKYRPLRTKYRPLQTKEYQKELGGFVTVGTVGGQQEGSQYSRVGSTKGWQWGVVGDSEYIR